MHFNNDDDTYNTQKNDVQNHGSAVPDSIEITATPLDGGLDLIKGQCKRIVFSYKFPTNVRAYVIHSAEVQDAAPGKYITWCGIFLKKVYIYPFPENPTKYLCPDVFKNFLYVFVMLAYTRFFQITDCKKN